MALDLRRGLLLAVLLGFASPAAGSCQACLAREHLKRLSLNQIKEQILAKLGLEAAPNATGRSLPRVPPLETFYERMQADQAIVEDRDEPQLTQRVIAFAQPHSEFGKHSRPKQAFFGPNCALIPYWLDWTGAHYCSSGGTWGDGRTIFSLGYLRQARMNKQGRGTSFTVELKKREHLEVLLLRGPDRDAKLRHYRGKEMLYFKFSEKLEGSRVVSADLWLYVRPTLAGSSSSSSGEEQQQQPLLYQIFRITPADPPLFSPFKSDKEVRRSRGRWLRVDVRRLVAEWFKSAEEYKGLAISAYVHGDSSLDAKRIFALSVHPDRTDFTPFLEVETAEEERHRSKRNTIGLNCPENSDETRCCRYPLKVDFEDFGWDWIIAPKSYEANYCSGECPIVFLPKYPHTHILHMANPSGTSGPCCAPRKMSSISMLYFDQNFNIIYGLLPGMVVDRCGCS